ncbi:transporter substrate-binding domain-containing protein [Thiocystis violacea]|uniref:transporter substrate-binding domain-containing protein n=1 Tax=Thiocystis violacea TaxID=13725 RepID=UPI0019089A45|nr:transporter substrate-binding domain-containing protein [Thiocystis violacea]MBK1720198.1 ABC transporter substrate-binding protein [Thiocystis violacea]
MSRGFLSVPPLLLGAFLLLTLTVAQARDLKEIREAGVLRHLGVPYANFITGLGDGLDVELVKGFAEYLGVRYEFVATTWTTAFGDLTGRNAKLGKDGGAERLDKAPIKGDILANGLTVLPWRQEIVDYSDPTFPSGVWLIARADSTLLPISPTGSRNDDISVVKTLIKGREVLALENTCLDPRIYQLEKTGANVRLPQKELKLNEMAPAILNNDAESTILDVPDALIALDKWPGEIKVIGPISDEQTMAAGFRKDSPELREAFNRYLGMIRKDGRYNRMVKAYYPTVFTYFQDFFATDS